MFRMAKSRQCTTALVCAGILILICGIAVGLRRETSVPWQYVLWVRLTAHSFCMWMWLGTCAWCVLWWVTFLDRETKGAWVFTFFGSCLTRFILLRTQVRGGVSWILKGFRERIHLGVGTLGAIIWNYLRCRRWTWRTLREYFGCLVSLRTTTDAWCTVSSSIFVLERRTRRWIGTETFSTGRIAKVHLRLILLGRIAHFADLVRWSVYRTIKWVVTPMGTCSCYIYLSWLSHSNSCLGFFGYWSVWTSIWVSCLRR